MGALQKIRNKGGLLVAVLGIALLFFILGELFTSGNTWLNKFKDKAFTVDGDVTSTGEYQDRVTQFEEFQKFISQQNTLDENMRAQISEFVYEQMVKEKILDIQAEELGLAVTKEELNDMVYGENISPILLQLPIFADPQTRQFNREGLMEFLGYIQTDLKTVPDEQKPQLLTFKHHWMVIENMMKYYRLEEKYNALLFSALSANDIEAKANYEDSKSTADIAYVLNRYSTIADSTVSVTDKEVEKLYNERKNNFKTTVDSRRITYLVKDIEPSEEDYKAVENEMNIVHEKMQTTTNPALVVADYSEVPYQDVYFSQSVMNNEEKTFVESASVGDIYGPIKSDNVYRLYKLVDRVAAPDSVKLQLIVVPEGTDALAANAKADSILTVIRGGKEFSTVANELNPQSNGGEVGWVTEQMIAAFGEDFSNKSFSGSKGDIFKLSARGMVQIVRIDDITRPVSKYKLALVQMPVVVSEKTLTNIDNELNTFVAENSKADSFYKAATEKGYNVIPDMALSPSSLGLTQVRGSQQIVYWAFNEKVGTVKKFDLSDQRVVALITGEEKAGYRPLKDVAEALKLELIKDKKAEKIISDLKSKGLTSLDTYAQAIGTKVDTVNFVKFTTANVSGIGREPSFNIAAAHSALNKVEGPLKGNSGVYVLSVLNRTEDATPFDAQTAKMMLDQSYMYRFNTQGLFESLKSKLDVVDNRAYVFYRADER